MHYIGNEERLIVLGIGDLPLEEKASFAFEMRDHLVESFNQTIGKIKITLQLSPNKKDFDFNLSDNEFDLGLAWEDQDHCELRKEIKEVTEGEHGFVFVFGNEDYASLAAAILDKAFNDEEVSDEDIDDIVEEFEEYWATEDGEEVSGPGKSDMEEAIDVIRECAGKRRFESPEDLLSFLVKEGLEDSEKDVNMAEIRYIYGALK